MKGYYVQQIISEEMITSMPKTQNIPLMVPDIQPQDIEAVVNVLKSGMLVQGRNVEELERSIANYLGVKHAIAVSNGTASLHLALLVLGIGPGDEVIVPAFSYIATANVVELVGAKPVFVDISLEDYNIDVEQIENKITNRTKAVIPVHEFGLACDIDKVVSIAKKHKIKVIEDAACALGATSNGRFAGTFGDVSSFSFHPRKAITGGEGGLIVTNNDRLADKFRVLRNHGISMSNGKMEFVDAGYNYRLTDFQAALILSQFQRLETILTTKDNLAKIYFDELADVNNIKLPQIPNRKRHTWQSFHIVISEKVDRDKLIVKLKKEGIGSNHGAQCIPYQAYYKNKYNLDSEKLFPNALNAFRQGLAIPLYEKLSHNDIFAVSNVLRKEL
jgi:dTDP-4-amino-4,6-dideoxygalactose transaminase